MALPDNQSGNMGGNTTSPNRAPAVKVIAGALANNRVAQALVAALGKYSIANVIIGTSTSTTVDFSALHVGDYVIHIPATAGNASFGQVVTAGTAPFAGVVGDMFLQLSAVNLDANNPLIPPTPNSNNGRVTGNNGLEF